MRLERARFGHSLNTAEQQRRHTVVDLRRGKRPLGNLEYQGCGPTLRRPWQLPSWEVGTGLKSKNNGSAEMATGYWIQQRPPLNVQLAERKWSEGHQRIPVAITLTIRS